MIARMIESWFSGVLCGALASFALAIRSIQKDREDSR